MNRPPILLIAVVLAGCGEGAAPWRESRSPDPEIDVRAEFLALARGDAWTNWPDGVEDEAADDEQPCRRVAELSRGEAISRLAKANALPTDAADYRRLSGEAPPAIAGSIYLLRGYSTTNSDTRVRVTGTAVWVHTDVLGRFSNLRRHPCLAVLRRPPAIVYTTAAYDL